MKSQREQKHKKGKKMNVYSIVFIYHMLFIHSSIDGQLGCFHLLAL